MRGNSSGGKSLRNSRRQTKHLVQKGGGGNERKTSWLGAGHKNSHRKNGGEKPVSGVGWKQGLGLRTSEGGRYLYYLVEGKRVKNKDAWDGKEGKNRQDLWEWKRGRQRTTGRKPTELNALERWIQREKKENSRCSREKKDNCGARVSGISDRGVRKL